MTEDTGQAKGTAESDSLPERLSATPFIVASLAALLIATMTLVVLLETAPAPALMALPAEQPPAVDDPDGIFVPETESSDDGKLSIEESGYSVIEDSIGEPLISWGAIVVNNSQDMAAGAVITVTLGADDGSKIDLIGNTVDLGPIPPGSRIGIGDETYISAPAIEDFQLTIDDVGWWYPEAVGRITDFTVNEIETWRAGEGEPQMHWDDEDGISEQVSDGRLHLRFRIDSGVRMVVSSPGTAALFRDESGAIIGGASLYQTDVIATIPPGWSYQEYWVKYGPPADYDESKTEVYVHRYRY